MTNSEKQQYIDARREYIESQFSHLNPKQREAVMATEGALLILAGAGSGKTTVLINRIASPISCGSGMRRIPMFCPPAHLRPMWM